MIADKHIMSIYWLLLHEKYFKFMNFSHNYYCHIVGASYKCHDQLQEAQKIENTKLIANDELETGQVASQEALCK
ncbi:hypothetical protein HN873_029154, partial [Arachis hypogaea]